MSIKAPVASREAVSSMVCGAICLVLVGLLLLGVGGGGPKQPGAGGLSPSSAPQPPATAQAAGPAQPADRSAIDDVLTRTFTQNDPRQCTQDITPGYLRHVFGAEKGALDRCRRHNTPQSEVMAQSIEIQSVSGGGSEATAVIKTSGANTLDGSVMTIGLVHQGDRWKLNKLLDVRIDRSRFDQHLRDELGSRGYLPAETSCAVGKLDRTVSDAAIETDLLIGESSYEYIDGAAVSCLSRPTLLRELSQAFTAAFSSRGVPTRVTHCVVSRLTHGVPIVRLRHLLAAGSRSAEAWWHLGYQAVLACAGDGAAGAESSSTT
jgi:hypothetical protein